MSSKVLCKFCEIVGKVSLHANMLARAVVKTKFSRLRPKVPRPEFPMPRLEGFKTKTMVSRPQP
jgi:hypothetical protein